MPPAKSKESEQSKHKSTPTASTSQQLPKLNTQVSQTKRREGRDDRSASPTSGPVDENRRRRTPVSRTGSARQSSFPVMERTKRGSSQESAEGGQSMEEDVPRVGKVGSKGKGKGNIASKGGSKIKHPIDPDSANAGSEASNSLNPEARAIHAALNAARKFILHAELYNNLCLAFSEPLSAEPFELDSTYNGVFPEPFLRPDEEKHFEDGVTISWRAIDRLVPYVGRDEAGDLEYQAGNLRNEVFAEAKELDYDGFVPGSREPSEASKE